MIIPTHNSESTIGHCLRSLTSQSYPREQFEIIVVDDGSKDNTVNLAHGAGADLVIETEPCFQGKARNRGAKQANGKILAFIDSDCEAKKGWLETIEKELRTCQAIGGVVVNANKHSLIAWAEYLIEFSDFNEYKNRSIVNFVPSCNQVCLKDVFLDVGGFPETRLSEDVFLGYSLQKSGIKIVFVPELQVRHFCRTNINKYLDNMQLLGKYSTRASKEVPSLYTKLPKTKWSIPLVFIIKLFARTRRAIRAKKLLIFITALPLVILGIAAFCKGVGKEFE